MIPTIASVEIAAEELENAAGVASTANEKLIFVNVVIKVANDVLGRARYLRNRQTPNTLSMKLIDYCQSREEESIFL